MIVDQRARTLSLFLVAFSGVALGRGSLASAQETTPIPEYTGDRVYVKDVPDQYQSLIPAIKQLERGSPQT